MAVEPAKFRMCFADAVAPDTGHAGRFQFASDLRPWLTVTREVSAVTGACMGIRTEVFKTLGGFDACFPNSYNDVDLCLRAGCAGLSVMCISAGELVHEECATRAGVTHLRERELFYERWVRKLSHADPFYSPSLRISEKIDLNFSDAASLFKAQPRDAAL